MRVFILFFENSFLCHFFHCCCPGRLTAVANASYFIFSCVVGRPYSSSLLSAESYILRIEWRQQPARLSVQHFVLYWTITTGGFRRLIDLASPFFSSLCCVFSIYFQALLILVSDFSFLFKQFSVRSYTWFRHAPHIRHYKLIRLDVLRRNEISEYVYGHQKEMRENGVMGEGEKGDDRVIPQTRRWQL